MKSSGFRRITTESQNKQVGSSNYFLVCPTRGLNLEFLTTETTEISQRRSNFREKDFFRKASEPFRIRKTLFKRPPI